MQVARGAGGGAGVARGLVPRSRSFRRISLPPLAAAGFGNPAYDNSMDIFPKQQSRFIKGQNRHIYLPSSDLVALCHMMWAAQIVLTAGYQSGLVVISHYDPVSVTLSFPLHFMRICYLLAREILTRKFVFLPSDGDRKRPRRKFGPKPVFFFFFNQSTN